MIEFDFPIRQVALFIGNRSDASRERLREGDILCSKNPVYFDGGLTRGSRQFLWLLLSGLPRTQMDMLKMSNSPVPEETLRYEKKRFSIPFSRLPALVDLARVRDPKDEYQPFMPIDFDTGRHLIKTPPLDVHGLVYDKVQMKFL